MPPRFLCIFGLIVANCLFQVIELNAQSFSRAGYGNGIFLNPDSTINFFQERQRTPLPEADANLLKSSYPSLYQQAKGYPEKIVSLRVTEFLLAGQKVAAINIDSIAKLIEEDIALLPNSLRIRYLILQSRHKYNQGKYSEGYKQASEASLLAGQKGIDRLQVEALAMVGQNYGMFGSPEQTLNYYRKAIALAQKISHKGMQAALANNMANIFEGRQTYDSALLYYEIAIANGSNTAEYPQLLIFKMNRSLMLQKLGRPSDFYKESYQVLRMADSLKFYNFHTQLYLLIAGVFNTDLKLDSAKKYASLGLKVAQEQNDRRIKVDYLNFLSEIEEADGNLKVALQYRKTLQGLKDSLISEEKDKALAETEAKYKLSIKEENLRHKEEEINAQRWLFAVALSLILSTVILLILFFRRKSLQQKAQLEAKELAFENQRLLLENTRMSVESEAAKREMSEKALQQQGIKQQELTENLALKERLLAAQTLNFISKAELVEEIKQICEQSQEPVPPIVLQQIKRLNDGFSSETEWNNFKTLFEQVHPNFIQRLTTFSPDITPTDVRLAVYIMMHLNPKQMAQMLGITYHSVLNGRSRLRKKLGLMEDADLNRFLYSLQQINSE